MIKIIIDSTKINILGTEYSIEKHKRENDAKLDNCDGYFDQTIKLIVVADFKNDADSLHDLTGYRNKVLRHEVIHAFLYESGLSHNSDWAMNEEMIDFFAIQFEKIADAMSELDILD